MQPQRQKGLPFTAKYEYDALGRKLSEINAKGVITKYTYDDGSNILTASIKANENAPEQTIQTNTYDLTGNLLTRTDGNGNTTSFEYNAFKKVRKAIFPGDSTISSNTVTYQYDILLANVKKQQDTAGKVNLITYDNQGRVLTSIEQKQDGTQKIQTSVKYDKNGNKCFETDANGVTKESTYDELNRLKTTKATVTNTEGQQTIQTTTYGYDANSNQTTVTDWRGNTLTNIYDPLNRLTEKKDPYGKTIQKLEYYDNSVQSKSYDAYGNATEFTYDRNNRLLTTKDPMGHITSQTYDEVGSQKTKTDGKNNTTTYEYDEFNRLVKVINAKNEATSYVYDLSGNVLTQTDGKGNITTFEYNVMNKPIKRIDHGGRTGTLGSYTYNASKTEKYTYYADGSMQTKIDRNGKTTLYSYDIHGRLLSQTVGGTTISYTYDNNGNQLSMIDSTGTTERTYDELGRVKTEKVPDIGTTTFKYDIISGVDAGCYAETATDPKGNITTKVYDKLGRLLKVTADNETTTYTYDDNGNKKRVVYPNGFAEVYTYYKDNLMESLTNIQAYGTGSQKTMDIYKYTYDEAHNQTSKDETINSVVKGKTLFTYDSLNRLETVTESTGKVTTYTFDKAGNRLTETATQGGATLTAASYTYNEQNRLTGTTTQLQGGVTEKIVYVYDNNGSTLYTSKQTIKPFTVIDKESFGIKIVGQNENLSTTETTFYKYDELNQMIKAQTNGKTTSYAYNGDGYRTYKESEGKITRYLYEYDKVVLEVDGAGNQTAKNVIGTQFISRKSGSDKYYYFYNGHADVTALVDAAGVIVGSYYYDAFGNILETSGVIGSPYRYAGYQYDEETGMYYLNARYYDPKIARFMTEDTYRGQPNDPLSLNLYTYCHNEPIMYKDPTGHNNSGDGVSSDSVITTYNNNKAASLDNSQYGSNYYPTVSSNDKSSTANTSAKKPTDSTTSNSSATVIDENQLITVQTNHGYSVTYPLKVWEGAGRIMVEGEKFVLYDIAGAVVAKGVLFGGKVLINVASEIGTKIFERVAVYAEEVANELNEGAEVKEALGESVSKVEQIGEEATGSAGSTVEGAVKTVGKSSEVTNLLDNMSGLTGSNRDKLLSTIQNSDLRKIVDQLYRPGATVGDGGTASKLVQEFYEGSSAHLLKATERLNQLNNLAKSGKLGLNDLDILEALRNDLNNAINLFK